MPDVKSKFTNIYDYIITNEASFKSVEVPLASNWRWNMFRHVDRSYHMKNSQFYKGKNDQESIDRSFNNLILPISNVAYRTEGFDVKDIDLYVDDKDYYHLSLIGRKYHDRWAIENSIDKEIDASVVSYFDYGLTLMRDENEKKPITINLKTKLAFCDQTDILSGPICLKHSLSVGEMQDMKGKWEDERIDEAVLASRFTRPSNNEGKEESESPGKNVEVYDLEGEFPESWLGKDKLGAEWEDTGKYTRQRHLISFYTDASDNRNGITLFKGKVDNTYKALKRDDIEGRACGRGGIEELFHSQIWTNYSEQHIQQMLEAVAKVVLLTTDKKLKNEKLSNIKHGQVLTLEEGKDFRQLQIGAINKTAFDNFINKWEQVARTIGSASDPQLGLNPVSGTPLGTTEIVTNQGQGIHEYRRGQIAAFWGEIYKDWVMKALQKDLMKGDEWLDELSLDELQEVAEKVSINQSNKRIKELVLNGKMVTPEEAQIMKELIKEQFMKGGQKRFLKIMKDEFKKLPLKLKINVAEKQTNLTENIAKLNNIFRAVFTPQGVQMLQSNQGLAELFNDILESSGLSPINYASLTTPIKSPLQPNDLKAPAGAGLTNTNE